MGMGTLMITIISLIVLGVIIWMACKYSAKMGLCLILICIISFSTVVLYFLDRNFAAFVDMNFFPEKYHWFSPELAPTSRDGVVPREWLPLPPNTAFRWRGSMTQATYTTKTNVEGIIEFYSSIADDGTFFVEHVEGGRHHLRILFRSGGRRVSILLDRDCSNEWLTINATTEERMADGRILNFLTAIEWQSKERARERFSNQAINEAVDFRSGITYFFDFFQGNVVSRELDRWQLEKSIENGKISEMLLSWHTVTTDKDTYLFFIADFISDMINPDNQGVYTLRVIKAEDADTQMLADWQDMLIPGIYIPEFSSSAQE